MTRFPRGGNCARRMAALLALAWLPRVAAAQSVDTAAVGSWLPSIEWFPALIADPSQPRNTAALIATDVLENTASPAERPPFELAGASGSRDVEGAVGLGFSRSIIRLDRWADGGIDLGITAGVFSRFRLEQPSRDELADDWFVGLPVTVASGPISARFRLLHHSSHMGDEAQEQGAARIEYSWEGLDGVVGWSPRRGSRVYGGGTVVVRNNSYTYVQTTPPSGGAQYEPRIFTEAGALQAGAETGWFPWADGDAGLVAGFDFQAADRSDWRGQYAIVAGLERRGGSHVGRLLARCYSGPSPMGEFFLSEEKYCGLEATIQF